MSEYVYEALPDPASLESKTFAVRFKRLTQRTFARPHQKIQRSTVHVSIRLLVLEPGQGSEQVHCRLVQASLFDLPKYEALSYVWGDASQTRNIILGGKNMAVTRNLCSALMHLRYVDQSRLLWVDAICINQMDLDERSSQVQAMKHIYSHCWRAVVWLGEPAEDDCRAFEIVRSLNRHLPMMTGEAGSETRLKAFRESQSATNLSRLASTPLDQIMNLFSRPWFGRIWVIQEVVKAPKAIAVYGYENVSLESMEKVANNIAINARYLTSVQPCVS